MNVIAHNIYAMNASRQYQINANKKAKDTEKLSSGYRINRAADDAAGLQISEEMRRQIRGLDRGLQNTMEGVSFIQVADGAMNEAHDMIQRISELSIQAANGTNSDSDREAIDYEIQQIKEELNQIGEHTVFNEMNVFDDYYVSMNIEGELKDLELFDATYDDATGKVTYGGFRFHGKRISWDTINPKMVSFNPSNGKQVFHGGSYAYQIPGTSYRFSFLCQDGEGTPQIIRTLDVSADASGVFIDGEHISWEDVKDEDDKAFSENNAHSGDWYIKYEGVDVHFFLGMKIENEHDMAKAINACRQGKINYTWQSEISGLYTEQAVDMNLKRLRIHDDIAARINIPADVTYTLRAGKNEAAGEDGIWLERPDGTKVEGSFQSWTDMGIRSWKNGGYIKDTITYNYSDTDGKDDTYISFDYYLSDVTSVDSVIDGLDGIQIRGLSFETSYSTDIECDLDSNILQFRKSSKNDLTYEEEKRAGRNFDNRTEKDVLDENITYDEAGNTANLKYKDTDGNDLIDFQGDTSDALDKLKGDMDKYLQYILKLKETAALAGKDPQNDVLIPRNLTDLVGDDHITTSGYFDNTVTINDSMSLSDGSKYGYAPGIPGHTYPTAFIDFEKLGQSGGFTLDDLIGLGFNSTCKTCSNHYSIAFVSGGTKDRTADGYGYNYTEKGSNYILEIDIDTLKANGVTDGAGLADAIVKITSECYDFHFTQYAAEGSKLYIFDDREQDTGATSATFDTKPFDYDLNINDYNVSLKTDDGRYVDLTYTYDFADAANDVIVEMKEDPTNGDYVWIDLSDGSHYFKKYDPADPSMTGLKRYKMDVTYKNQDGSDAAALDETIASYANHALEKMLTKTNVSMDATDYTYLNMLGDENPNVAIGANWESTIVESTDENEGIRIQNSAQFGDEIKIPRICLNSYVLNLDRAGAKTEQQALKTIKYTDYALAFLSKERSLYGAYQNRLEHTYKANSNTRENLQDAESKIRDTDMAEQMVSYALHNIVEQAAQSMLAQANHISDWVLQLL